MSAEAGIKRTPARQGFEWLFLAGAVTVLLLSTRPYVGIDHDAILYMAQALNRLEGAPLSGDVFFRFGSQDSFSVFSAIFAPAVGAMGPALAHWLFWVLGQALWIAGLVAVCLALFPDRRTALVAAAAGIGLFSFYGTGALRYAEPFVTPRLFAEAILLAGFGALLARREALAAMAVLLAAALHPLTAAPAILAMLLYWLGFGWRMLVVAAAGTTALVVLVVAGIGPFGRANTQIDVDWMAVLLDRSPHAFVSVWTWQTLARSSFALVMLVLVLRLGTERQRRLAGAVLVACLASLLASLVFGDVLRNLLVINLQFWRSLWLLTLFGNVLALAVLAGLPPNGLSARLLIATMVLSFVESIAVGLPLAALAMLGAFLVSLGANAALWRLTAKGFALAALLVFAAEIAAIIQNDGIAALLPSLYAALLGGLAVLLLLRLRAVARISGPMLAAMLALLAMASPFLDHRSDWQRFVEGGGPDAPELRALVEDRAVYWESGFALQWIRFRQPAFYSCQQGAGAMFYRETAMEYLRRSEVLNVLNTADFAKTARDRCYRKADPARTGPASVEAMAMACRDLPDLDRMVLFTDVEQAGGQAVRLPVTAPHSTDSSAGLDAATAQEMFVYDCDALR